MSGFLRTGPNVEPGWGAYLDGRAEADPYFALGTRS